MSGSQLRPRPRAYHSVHSTWRRPGRERLPHGCARKPRGSSPSAPRNRPVAGRDRGFEEGGAMKVFADLKKCDGYGTCVIVAPKVFSLDESGFVTVLIDNPPEELSASV